VVIFSKSKVTQNARFMPDNKELDICESYNYLEKQQTIKEKLFN
jgi:hypothetical protein